MLADLFTPVTLAYHTCLSVPRLLTFFTHVPCEAWTALALASGRIAASAVHTITLLHAVAAVRPLGAFWEQKQKEGNPFIRNAGKCDSVLSYDVSQPLNHVVPIKVYLSFKWSG